jgi:hypothetical protein
VDSETSRPYKNSSVSSIIHSLVTVPIIAQFQKLVHLKNSSILTGIHASNLFVYMNKAAFDRRNNAQDEGKVHLLKASQNLDDLGESEEEALVVTVPCLIKMQGCKRKQAKHSAFWFLLVDSATGQPYKGTTASSVSLSPDADIIEFRKLVHLEISCILTGIDPSDHLVYKNKTAFDRRNSAAGEEKEQPLKPTESIGILRSTEDMLVVATLLSSQPP